MVESYKKHIGDTPPRYLPILSEKYNILIYAKEEYYNLGMSSKDRPAYYMIHKALTEGKHSAGVTIVRASNSNTGLGIAIIAGNLDFKCQILVSDKISIEKKAILESQGTTVTVCPSSVSSEDPHSTYKMAAEFERKYENTFSLNQYHNPANVIAHHNTTGPEIYYKLNGNTQRFIAGADTCGTIIGVGTYLKKQDNSIEIVAVDAHGSILTSYFKTGKIDNSVKRSYTVEGFGKGFIPGILNCDPIYTFIQISDIESINAAQYLGETAGHLIGNSSGAVVATLEHLKNQFRTEENTVLFLPDHGSRYLSKIYNEAWINNSFSLQKAQANKTYA